MSKDFDPSRRAFTRGLFLGSAAAATGLAAPALAQVDFTETTQFQEYVGRTVRHNTSGFRARSWEPHFDNLRNGAILCDTVSRAVHFWGEDGQTYRLFPSSVPMSNEMTRRGRTSITRKVEGPSWAPTPSMLRRNPDWPRFIPPGPENPMGTHALHLSWQYYRIHGTHDVRRIGRRSSNGCIGLFNEHIEELYGLTRVGTQVLLI
ncbi:MAG: L,D-transpeptidase [Rhodobacteraceae bacterium]|nr:L,D-transpeptidase [Paracoccaceae bacterium]